MYIHIKVITRAKQEYIQQISDNRFIVSVREKAEQNKANMRARELLAEKYSVALSSVRIIHGHHTPTKLLSITLLNEI